MNGILYAKKRALTGVTAMTVIELPDDLAAALKAKAAAQDLKLEDWFRTLTDAPASGGSDLDRVFADIRGLADDIDFGQQSRNTLPTGEIGKSLKLPALPLGDIGSLHRRDIYDDAS
ncbi:MAG: hypothetical protein JO028_12230 [Acidobacteriaceae bacterium]|nr:hypothetical protein [Acidobacteriaceae bacterium]